MRSTKKYKDDLGSNRMVRWDYTCKNGTTLRNAIGDNDLGYATSMIRTCISEIVRHYAKLVGRREI